MRKYLSLLALLVISIQGLSQEKGDTIRIVTFSLVPGFGSSGVHPGRYTNIFSFNLFSGYSASNLFLEVGGLSNLNEHRTRGLQVAGLVNLTGGNSLSRQEVNHINTGSALESNLTGLQVSGLANVVINNVFGGQISLGTNVSQGGIVGAQIAGLVNVVKKYSFGFQGALVSNISFQSMNGMQLAGLSNYTAGELEGVQIGFYNEARISRSPTSDIQPAPRGIQIGAFNYTSEMSGTQIGLINIGKVVQGTQIGIINLYRGGSKTETKDGVAIGLINWGGLGYLSFFANELFPVNIELATGNSRNRRIFSREKNIYIMNNLMYSNHPSGIWSIGYGVEKMYFNRSTAPYMDEFRFLAFGLSASHINHERGKISHTLNIHPSMRVSFGTKIWKKVNIYCYSRVSANFFVGEGDIDIIKAPSLEFNNSRFFRKAWLGLSLGILTHF